MELFQVFICTKCVLLCCGLFLYVQTIKCIHCFMAVNDTFVVVHCFSDSQRCVLNYRLCHVFPHMSFFLAVYFQPFVLGFLVQCVICFSKCDESLVMYLSLFPFHKGTQKSVLVTCSSTIHMEWQGYTRSLEHAVVITFKWAHATVPFRSDALEKLSTRTQSPLFRTTLSTGSQAALFAFTCSLILR